MAAAAAKSLQSCTTLCDPTRRQPTRLPRPWDSPGKNTGVGCHVLLQCMKVKSEREVAQLCPTLSDPMDCSLPGSSFHGIFQARVLEWGAIAFSLKDGSSHQRTGSSTKAIASLSPQLLNLMYSWSLNNRRLNCLGPSKNTWTFKKVINTTALQDQSSVDRI